VVWADGSEEEILFEGVVKAVSIKHTSARFSKDAFNKMLENYAKTVKRELRTRSLGY
jgi:hypothetical protein